jgi:simple sugar transport system permease protein
MNPKTDYKNILIKNAVPIFFAAICIFGVISANINMSFLMSELISRLARNSFLVLSLIIPVIAGLGLNFGIVLGAMSAQAALIAVTHWQYSGWEASPLSAFLIATLISTPIALIAGFLVGKILNKAKGREMITSMMLGFFANGIYQLIFLVLVGSVIPMENRRMMLPSGVGLRNTVDIYRTSGNALNNIISVQAGTIRIPVFTLIVVAVLCVALYFFLRTKLGQQLRAVGQDMHVSEVSGINVNKMRIIAVIISTVLAAWGQLIFLQDIGTINTYNSHEQVGMFAIAALLVGGANTKKATIAQALIGVILFHTLFVVSPLAGQSLFGIAQIGEYFIVFIAYGVIGVALALHAWKKNK